MTVHPIQSEALRLVTDLASYRPERVGQRELAWRILMTQRGHRCAPLHGQRRAETPEMNGGAA